MISLYDVICSERFEHLLCILAKVYKSETVISIYSEKSYQYSLDGKLVQISLDEPLALRFENFLIANFGMDVYEMLYHVFLCNTSFSPTLISKYILLLKKNGAAYHWNHSDSVVREMHHLEQKVTFEAHRFLGILRFHSFKNILIGKIEPDHQILTLLAYHFVDRLKNEDFIILDERHKKALVYEKQMLRLVYLDKIPHLKFEIDEYENLWKIYFDHIAIEDRQNPKLQQHFVPLKYRKNMIEFQ